MVLWQRNLGLKSGVTVPNPGPAMPIEKVSAADTDQEVAISGELTEPNG